MYLSSQIVLENLFRILRHLLDSVSLSVVIHAVLWGFVSVSEYDPLFCQDFRVLETKRRYSVVLVCVL